MPPIYYGSAPFALKRGSQALNLYYGSTLISGGAVPASVRTFSGSYVGDGVTTFPGTLVSLGFEPDLIIVKGLEAMRPAMWHKATWYGRTDRMEAAGVRAIRRGLRSAATGFRVRHDTNYPTSSINATGVTYHYVAIKDNGANILRWMNWNGNATAGRTVDMLSGQPVSTAFIKRDWTEKAVFAWSGGTATDTAGTLFAPNAAAIASGVLTLSAADEVNKWGSLFGEGVSCAAFLTGDKFYRLDYTGNGAVRNGLATLPFEPETVMIFPRQPTTGASEAQMWFSHFTAGQHIAWNGATIGTGRLTVNVGTGSATVDVTAVNQVNENAKAYTLIAVAKDRAASIPTYTPVYNKEVQLTAGYINCGTHSSLEISGPITLEFFGSIAPSNIDAHVTQTPNSETGKQYPIMWRGNGADIYPHNDLPYNVGDTPNVSWGINAVNGHSGSPYEGTAISVPAMNYFSIIPDDAVALNGNTVPFNLNHHHFNTGYRIDDAGLVHIIVTHAGSGVWTVFVNGRGIKERKLDIETIVGGQIKNCNGYAGHSMTFGARKRSGGSPDLAHNMKFRMARIYNTALTAAEALSNYRACFGLASAKVGFIEEWDARNAVGASLPATVNSANNGTIVNGSVVSV